MLLPHCTVQLGIDALYPKSMKQVQFNLTLALWHISSITVEANFNPNTKLYKDSRCSTFSYLSRTGVLKVFLNTPRGIEIRCWGYSTVYGSKVQLRTQVLTPRTWTNFHPDWLWLDTSWLCSDLSIWTQAWHFNLLTAWGVHRLTKIWLRGIEALEL